MSLRRLFSSPSTPRRAPRHARKVIRRCGLEPLENRALMCATYWEPPAEMPPEVMLPLAAAPEAAATAIDAAPEAAATAIDSLPEVMPVAAESPAVPLNGSPLDFFTAAVQYGQMLQDQGPVGQGGSFVSIDHIEETEEVVSNHMIMTRWDLSLIFYTQFNTMPTASAGGPYSINEGEPLKLDASASGDADGDELSYSWDINGDGVYSDATGESPELSWAQLNELGIRDEGSRLIGVKVDDGYGGVVEATTTLTVVNAAPSIELINNVGQTVEEGTPVQIVAQLSDAGSDDQIGAAWSVTKNGEAYAEGEGAEVAFTPDDNGTYIVTMTATDNGGASSSATATIDVLNVAPEVAIVGLPESGVEGTEISLASTVADPGAADTHTYAWEILKDGELYQSGEGDSLSFTPDDEGSYEVRLTVTDDDGGATTAIGTVAVANANPVAEIAGLPEAAVEGAAIALTGSAADPGVNDTQTLAWNVTKNGEAYASGEGADFSFTPDDNGTYAVTLVATDNDGGAGQQIAEIVVANANPVLGDVAMPELNGVDGLTSVSGTIADPGTADTFTLLVDWGDGQTQSFEYAAGTTSFNESHQYAHGGVYQVNLTLVDDDLGTDSAAATTAVVGVGVNGRALQIVGTNDDDYAAVGQLPNNRYVVSTSFSQQPWQPAFFTAGTIDRIEMYLNGGNDVGMSAGIDAVPLLADGGAGDDRLMATRGNNVLIGGLGEDVLFGGRGRNVLIGGLGEDYVLGSRGEDLVIGGTTAYDANREALMSILGEWSSDRDVDTRMANLSGTGSGDRSNGSFLLLATGDDESPASVFDDLAQDVLLGGHDSDWYFGRRSGSDQTVLDLLVGRDDSERFDELA